MIPGVGVAWWPSADLWSFGVAGVAGLGALMRFALWFATWRRRPKPAADVAVAWWLWNALTGARFGTGPSLADDRDLGRVVLSRTVRAVPRWIPPAGACAVAYVIPARAPLGTGPVVVAGAGAAGTVVLAALVWGTVRVVTAWWHWRRWVRPLELVLRGVIGFPEDLRARKWLRVPRALGDHPLGVRVYMRRDFAADRTECDRIERVVRSKLALPADRYGHHWQLVGRDNFLQVRSKDLVPATAFYSVDPAVDAALAAAKPSAPLIGLTVGGDRVAIDLDSESPHVLLSAGTGGGKSAMLRFFAAQLLRNGAMCWVIDLKRHSQPWLRGIPGVRYFRDIGDIYNALTALAREGDRRNRAWDDVGLGEQGPVFPRILVICEELNATMSKLRLYWRQELREPGETQCPAVLALGDLLFMGRAVQIHVAAIAQYATANDLGGPQARENFATRILARYSRNAARMLVPECELPASTRHPGRAQVCIGGQAIETQLGFMTPEQARDYALAGDRRVIDVAASQLERAVVHQGGGPATVTGPAAGGELEPADDEAQLEHLVNRWGADGVRQAVDRVEPARRFVTLAEASADKGEDLIGAGLRYDSLRQAVHRYRRNGQPAPEAHGKRGDADLYDLGELAHWQRNRPGSGR